jgi:hypothetical protein
MEIQGQKIKDLKIRWDKLSLDKAGALTLCEEYARWTLPYMFPAVGANASTEMQLAKDSIGAKAVNHLSNKVVSTLFPAQTIFFRLKLDAETRALIAKAMQAAGAPTVEDAKAEMSKAMVQVDTELAEAEKTANEYMDMVAYRPQATTAAKLLIITGNALMYHPKDRPVQVYNLRDYCVQRDLSGTVIEIMTKECKAFETFSPAIQAQLRDKSIPNSHSKEYLDTDNVNIYTQVKLENDGKYHVYQCADHVLLDTDGAYFTKKDMPWIPLTWNLIRGEDYGRGLVGDYSGAFHAVNVLSGSLLNIAAVMGDIKFLVRSASHVDIDALNNSASGSYHAGNKDDVTCIEVNKLNDAQFIATMIERYEKQINEAFLLMSARQAERVTAEEIRRDANELETSNGGIYSSLAMSWQVPTANIVLEQSGFEGLNDGIMPQIVTGMDSLSRAAEIDNLRLFFADLQLLNTVPEDIRAGIDVPGLMQVIGTARQVEYKSFTKTAAQMQAEQEAALAQQQQMLATEAQGKVAEEAGKSAVKEE